MNGGDDQKHFLCTMEEPVYSYSALVIHMVWNDEREARMEPPIHTKNFLSSGAQIFTFIDAGASAVSSLLIL